MVAALIKRDADRECSGTSMGGRRCNWPRNTSGRIVIERLNSGRCAGIARFAHMGGLSDKARAIDIRQSVDTARFYDFFDPLYLRVDAPQRHLVAPYTHLGLPERDSDSRPNGKHRSMFDVV